MSTIEKIDEAIETLIDNLIEEYEKDGILSSPAPERKADIIKQIAKLRASMTPQCNCQR